jgi:hypothetical protein
VFETFVSCVIWLERAEAGRREINGCHRRRRPHVLLQAIFVLGRTIFTADARQLTFPAAAVFARRVPGTMASRNGSA